MNTYDKSEIRQEATGNRQQATGKEEGMKEKVYHN